MEYSVTVHLLCKTGLLALCKKMDDSAETILSCARTVLHDPVALDISCAMIHSARGDVESAVRLLQDRALSEFPEHDMARTALGIVLQLGGRQGWSELYGQVLASSSDPLAREAALEGLRAQNQN